MKKKLLVGLSLVLTLGCIFAIAVSATEGLQQSNKVPVIQKKNYYAYYNESSMKGAVAFCLDNAFTSYGDTAETIKLCTKNTDGSYTTLYEIDKTNVSTWFYGKSEHNVSTGENLSSLLGGLSAIGITLESNKTNFAFALKGQKIAKGTEYYVYIPDGYFKDTSGNSNAACYLKINPADVNSYTGDLSDDLKTAASGIYDTLLFAAENVGSLLP